MFWLPAILSVAVPPVGDFTLRDYRGAERKLSDWNDSKIVVVAFLGVDCPLAKLYARRLGDMSSELSVPVIGIDSNRSETLRDLAQFARKHDIRFPLLKDSDGRVADRFGATRTPEVFLLDGERRIRYRGRIDDQYLIGLPRARPSRRDLAVAIEELRAGKTVSVPETQAVGCFIDRSERPAARGEVTWTKHVAPILQKHCVTCHRPGEIAPFPLTSFEHAYRWADTVREVVDAGRMPPWSASPKHGTFANDPRLSEESKKIIRDWVDNGCPEGSPADLPPPPSFPAGWNIGRPDQVVSMEEPFAVPAEGVIDYQHFIVDPKIKEDCWVKAAEIRPGNRAVVHHCTVFLVPPGEDEAQAAGKLGSHCLAATAPGTPPLVLPDGMAKLVPAGSRFLFVVHYTPVGSIQQDRTSLGLIFEDSKNVRREVATHLLYDENLRIPANAADHRVVKSWRAPADILLLAMFPHMHLRGKSFRYEAVYPDNSIEVLLDVPNWDFNWQHRYVLAEPKRLPTGTEIRCTAVYNNSADNPANPDPNQEVRAGKQTWEEMFNGYFEWALADEDLRQPPPCASPMCRLIRFVRQPMVLLSLAAALALLGGLQFLRRRR